MKYYLFLWLSIISFNAHSQSKQLRLANFKLQTKIRVGEYRFNLGNIPPFEKSYWVTGKTPKNRKIAFFEKLNSCEEARRLAHQDFKKGLKIMVNLVERQNPWTYAILERDYGVVSFYTYEPSSEIICYNEVIREKLMHIYGEHLMDSCIAKADSLIKYAGIIYEKKKKKDVILDKTPTMKSSIPIADFSQGFIKTLSQEEIKKLIDFNQSFNFQECYLSTDFWINEDGSLHMIVEDDLDILQVLAKKLFTYLQTSDIVWQPAIYKGKKVKTAMHFNLTYDIL